MKYLNAQLKKHNLFVSKLFQNAYLISLSSDNCYIPCGVPTKSDATVAVAAVNNPKLSHPLLFRPVSRCFSCSRSVCAYVFVCVSVYVHTYVHMYFNSGMYLIKRETTNTSTRCAVWVMTEYVSHMTDRSQPGLTDTQAHTQTHTGNCQLKSDLEFAAPASVNLTDLCGSLVPWEKRYKESDRARAKPIFGKIICKSLSSVAATTFYSVSRRAVREEHKWQ